MECPALKLRVGLGFQGRGLSNCWTKRLKDRRLTGILKDRRESKRREVIYPSYNERIYNFNKEKQTALLGCQSQAEVERVIEYLRKKWNV